MHRPSAAVSPLVAFLSTYRVAIYIGYYVSDHSVQKSHCELNLTDQNTDLLLMVRVFQFPIFTLPFLPKESKPGWLSR